MLDKPEHHKCKVVRISSENILVHPNADKLDIVMTLGYQTVVKKGDFVDGTLAVFIPPDSIVPVRDEFSFLWKDKTIPGEEVPIKYRRIKAVRLRKEWSEGLLFPISSLNVLAKEGDDISELLGIEHYNPPDPEDTKGQNERGPKRHLPRSLKGWIYYIWWTVVGWFGFGTPLQGSNEKGPKFNKPYYDIENLKHHTSIFEEGEEVVITEKLHGCQGKFVYQNGKQFVGSRNYWKSKNSKCIWRKCLELNPWIEEWCKNNEDYTLYGEVIPCQGDRFMYGYKQGEVGFKVFDILTPEYTWISKKELFYNNCCSQCSKWSNFLELEQHWVPLLYEGLYDSEKIKSLVDGKSQLGGGMKEGIVITSFEEKTSRGLGRKILKLISNEYLSKE